jgi:hypothetical protein
MFERDNTRDGDGLRWEPRVDVPLEHWPAISESKGEDLDRGEDSEVSPSQNEVLVTSM